MSKLKKPTVYVEYTGEKPILVRLEDGGTKVEMKKGDVAEAQYHKAKALSTHYRFFDVVDAVDLEPDVLLKLKKEKEDKEKATEKLEKDMEKAAEKARKDDEKKAPELEKKAQEANVGGADRTPPIEKKEEKPKKEEVKNEKEAEKE